MILNSDRCQNAKSSLRAQRSNPMKLLVFMKILPQQIKSVEPHAATCYYEIELVLDRLLQSYIIRNDVGILSKPVIERNVANRRFNGANLLRLRQSLEYWIVGMLDWMFGLLIYCVKSEKSNA